MFVIIEKYFHLVPLLTGICVQEELQQTRIKTRFSNNFVESWFRQVKHYILKKRKVSTSELTSALYKRLLSKYHQFYSEKPDQNSTENAKINQITEKWKDKNEKYKREKGFYYDNHQLHGTLYDYEYDDMENENFTIIFSKYLRSKEFGKQSNITTNGDKLDDHKSQNQEYIINNKIFDQESSNDIRMEVTASFPEKIVNMDTDCYSESHNEEKKNLLTDSTFTIDQIISDRNTSVPEVDSNFDNLIKKFPIQKDLSGKDYVAIFSVFNKISRPEILHTDVKNYVNNNSDFLKRIINNLRSKEPNLNFQDQKLDMLFVSKLALPENLLPLKVSGDGNCLYNSFSKTYFNDEKYFYIFKLCSIFILFEYEIFFKRLMICNKYTYSLENFILKTCRNREWGTELNILSISILLNRKIISYSESKHSFSNVNNRLIYNMEEYSTRPILIGLSSLHFFPIVVNDQTLVSKLYVNKDIDFLNEMMKEEIKEYK